MKNAARFWPLVSLLFSLSAAAASMDGSRVQQSFSFDNGDDLRGSSTQFLFNSRHGAFYPDFGTPVSRFLVDQDFASGTGTLHYGGLVAEDERHYYGGLSLGSVTLAYVHGGGDSYSKAPNPLYRDLDQYYFHGGTRSTFNFQGVAADIPVAGGLSSQLAYTAVTAAGVEDRSGYYAGAAGRHFNAGVFQIDRGGDKVGSGMNFGLSRGKLDLTYQEIDSDYGAAVRRVAFRWSASPAQSITLELEQAHNDLFPGGDEQRIMLRFRKRLGRSPAFSAASSDDAGGGQAEKKGFGKAVGIGVGLGVAAIAVSSGSGGKDSTPRYAVRNQAAFAVLNRINPLSVRENRERGGWVYRNADNTFGYTTPVLGTISSVNIGNPVTSVPTGTTANASYHTHGGPDPRYDNEHFSPQDLLSDRLSQTDGYLGTPAGFMKLHDYRTDSITVVGRIAN